MVLVVDANNAQKVTELLQECGEKVYTIGSLVKKTTDECTVRNMEVWN
jgi:homoserine kinase